MGAHLKINFSELLELNFNELSAVFKVIELDSLRFLKDNFFHEIDFHSVLLQGSKKNDLKLFKKFIDVGFDVSSTGIRYDNIDLSPLMVSCSKNNIVVSEFLIRNGVDLNLVSEELDTTALMIAIEMNSYECAKLLIESGADLNIENKEGKTALYIAKSKFRNKIADLLIEYGAQVNIKT